MCHNDEKSVVGEDGAIKFRYLPSRTVVSTSSDSWLRASVNDSSILSSSSPVPIASAVMRESYDITLLRKHAMW